MKHIGILILCLGCSLAKGQHVLSGKILDSETRMPLAKASVYFPELFRTTISDVNGAFQIPGIAKGRFLMQVTHVGYENYFINLEISRDTVADILMIPSLIQMKEVVVTGTHTQAPDETSFNIIQLNRDELDQNGAFSVSDAISRLPGASQLTTGAGISKPVIRGLYGNRIQINVNGLRFDNQQWQDEHGLGLSDMGVDRIEIIRGPASVLYGSDALGGVVNIIEEKPAAVDSTERDMTGRLFSNTLGVSFNYGLKKSFEKKWKKFRIGFDNHADYNDGNNDRVLNSRFASYNLKASWGKNRDGSVHVVNLIASHSLFGFVFDSLSRKREDARLSRSFDGPHHSVSFIKFNTENTYYRKTRKVKVNGGFISNLRLEDEGGGGISLSMLLNTLNGLGQITKNMGDAGEWTYGSSVLFQSNTNFGGRIIIPDAINGEASLFSFYKDHFHQWLVEGGVRYDRKFIETFATQNLNVIGNESPTQDIVPFTNSYNAYNFSLGAGYNLTSALLIKANASTGYRPGNLAELSSNGLHEGTLRWEIGLPNAKIERNVNIEGSITYDSKSFRSSVSIYRNSFQNFFYLSPTGTEYYGFNIYRFQQSDAFLRGGEISFDWNPFRSRIELNSSYTLIDARKSDGTYLPFIPANKITSEVRIHIRNLKGSSQNVIRLGGNYVFDQDHPAQFETSTNHYFLLNMGVSSQADKIRFSLMCNNLLNKTYYDHLSRFKYYGIGNMGRNIVLTIKF